jgi:hypothetical protein
VPHRKRSVLPPEILMCETFCTKLIHSVFIVLTNGLASSLYSVNAISEYIYICCENHSEHMTKFRFQPSGIFGF